MSRADIISEIPNQSHEARREIMRCLIEAEEEAATLSDCDQRALERFQMLDAMEALGPDISSLSLGVQFCLHRQTKITK